MYYFDVCYVCYVLYYYESILRFLRVIENVFDRVIYKWFFILLCYFDLCHSEVLSSKHANKYLIVQDLFDWIKFFLSV